MVPLDFSTTRVLTVGSASPFNAALHAKFIMPSNNPVLHSTVDSNEHVPNP